MKNNIIIIIMLLVTSSLAQEIPPPMSNIGESRSTNNILFEPPPPVLINGKDASTLSDDEMRSFLNSKILNLYQDENSTEIIKIAPGYAVTIVFPEQVSAVILGDEKMFSKGLNGRILVLSAKARASDTCIDTSMQVILPGNKILTYHLFITPNYADAMTTVRINLDNSLNSGVEDKGNSKPDFKKIANVVANYNALIQEHALSSSAVSRIPVMKKSVFGLFQYYYWYKFANGTLVLSFLINNGSKPFHFDQSRLRLQVGDVRFLPTQTSVSSETLAPDKSATGMLIFDHPPFSLNQPFEVVIQ